MCSTLAKSMYVLVYIRAMMALSIFSVIGRACTINLFFSKQRYQTKFLISRTSCKLPLSLFADHVSFRQIRFGSCMIRYSWRAANQKIWNSCPSPPA